VARRVAGAARRRRVGRGAREAPEGWDGHTGHIDAELVRQPADGAQLAFVCGSNGFVETASELLVGLGMEPGTIRTERFGPTS
jgi:ferredoxin-NADP reductase